MKLHYCLKFQPTQKDKEVLKHRLDAFIYFDKARELIRVARKCKEPYRSQYLTIAKQMHNAARHQLRRIHEVLLCTS